MDTITTVREHYNPGLRFAGVIINADEPHTITGRERLEELRAAVPVIEPVIPKRAPINDAAEAQIEVMTAQAAEEIATANARAYRTEQAQRVADSERADADAAAAAAEAAAVAEAAQARLGEAQAEIAAIEQARQEMARTRDQLLEQLDQARAEREHAHAEQRLADLRATHTEHITNLRAELEQSRQATQAERSRADRAEARLDRPTRAGGAQLGDGHG